MFLRFTALVLCLASPAFAECLTQDNFIDSEVTAALQAGDEWRITRNDEGVPGGVQAEYRDKYGEPLRWQVSAYGVYPRFEQQNVSVDAAAPNATPFPAANWEMETVYDLDPPPPVAGGGGSKS